MQERIKNDPDTSNTGEAGNKIKCKPYQRSLGLEGSLSEVGTPPPHNLDTPHNLVATNTQGGVKGGRWWWRCICGFKSKTSYAQLLCIRLSETILHTIIAPQECNVSMIYFLSP